MYKQTVYCDHFTVILCQSLHIAKSAIVLNKNIQKHIKYFVFTYSIITVIFKAYTTQAKYTFWLKKTTLVFVKYCTHVVLITTTHQIDIIYW